MFLCSRVDFGFSLVRVAESQRSPAEGDSGRPRPQRTRSPQTPNGPVEAVHHELPEVQTNKNVAYAALSKET